MHVVKLVTQSKASMARYSDRFSKETLEGKWTQSPPLTKKLLITDTHW